MMAVSTMMPELRLLDSDISLAGILLISYLTSMQPWSAILPCPSNGTGLQFLGPRIQVVWASAVQIVVHSIVVGVESRITDVASKQMFLLWWRSSPNSLAYIARTPPMDELGGIPMADWLCNLLRKSVKDEIYHTLLQVIDCFHWWMLVGTTWSKHPQLRPNTERLVKKTRLRNGMRWIGLGMVSEIGWNVSVIEKV